MLPNNKSTTGSVGEVNEQNLREDEKKSRARRSSSVPENVGSIFQKEKNLEITQIADPEKYDYENWPESSSSRNEIENNQKERENFFSKPLIETEIAKISTDSDKTEIEKKSSIPISTQPSTSQDKTETEKDLSTEDQGVQKISASTEEDQPSSTAEDQKESELTQYQDKLCSKRTGISTQAELDKSSGKSRSWPCFPRRSEHVFESNRAAEILHGIILEDEELQFALYPVHVFCPYCEEVVLTEIFYKPGLLVFSVCSAMTLLCCWLGCCLLPFCIPEAHDVEHFCPICETRLGVCKLL